MVQSGDGGAEKDSLRLVSDYKAVNEQVEKSQGVMPNQEADMVDLLSASYTRGTPKSYSMLAKTQQSLRRYKPPQAPSTRSC